MSKKKELGKGIKTLLRNIEDRDKSTPEAAGVRLIALSKIERNPDQPRNEFDEETLEELASSIKLHGIIQPLTLRRLSANAFQIIAGERRWRASKLAGLTEVPAYVREANDVELLEMALIENIQREDLNAIEVAISYERLIQECSITQEELASRVGKKRSTIANYVRLLKLSPVMQKALKGKLISMGHARVLAGIDDPLFQMEVFQKVINNHLSVRQTEQLAASKVSSKSSASQSKNPEIKKIEDALAQKLGAKVSIKRDTNGKGSISIPFGNDDQLNSILDNLDY